MLRNLFCSAVSFRRWASSCRPILLQSALDQGDSVKIEFVGDDGEPPSPTSSFPYLWLFDHHPASLHPTSKQRTLMPPGSTNSPFSLETRPTKVYVEKDKLHLEWVDVAGNPQKNVYDGDWLYKRRFSSNTRSSIDDVFESEETWETKDFENEKIPSISSSEFCGSEMGRKKGLLQLAKFGVFRIQGFHFDEENPMPAVEDLCTRVGLPRETFYGRMWDTKPKAKEKVNDTAFTKMELPVHTDTCYLENSPGVQIFACVEQSLQENPDFPYDGSTRLVDGFRIIDYLRDHHLETYQFFKETPLIWYAKEEGVYARAKGSVIEETPYRRFRYNPLDLDELTYLNSSKIYDYYHHNAVLNRVLHEERFMLRIKLQVGDAIVVNNHRVLHGREAFVGSRNMMGCYVGVDEWKNSLRVLLDED